MKNRIIASLFITIAVGGFAYFHFSKSSSGQATSASQSPPPLGFDKRMNVLQDIPIVEGWEHPKEDLAFYTAEKSAQAELMTMFADFQNYNVSHETGAGAGGLHRGTHAKGQCFTGDFTILKDDEIRALNKDLDAAAQATLVQRLKQGFLASTSQSSYPVVMRFANADGTGRLQPDTKGDVRGFSFSIQNLPGQDFLQEHRQDFMMNSTAAFASGEIHEFAEIVKAAGTLTYHKEGFPFKPKIGHIVTDAIDIYKIQKGDKEGASIQSYAAIDYWANLAYSHGLDANGKVIDAVKYKVTPCQGPEKEKVADVSHNSADYLQEDIVTRAANGQICFDLQLEFYDLEALRNAATNSVQKKWTQMDWIENSGILWDETKPRLQFHTVARIEAKGPPIACVDQYINTRLHSNPANQPMGSIARVRTYIEEYSRARRMGETN